jgi:hypothetical protein
VDLVITDNGDAAYYPSAPGNLLTFANFKEAAAAYHDPADVGGGGGGGAPTTAEYVVFVADATLSAEKVLGTDVIMAGVVGSRPAFGTAGRLYYATDEGILYRDSGSAWVKIGASDHADLDNLTAGNPHTQYRLTATALITTDLADDAVTYAKIQNVATDRLLGRDTAGSGDAEELTVGGGVEFTGSGGIQRSALTGDVTAAAGSGATAIAADAVTYAKMQDVSATDRLLGRDTAGAGNVEEIAPAAVRTMLDVPSNAEAVLDTLLDAKGDVIVASANDTPARLAVGTEHLAELIPNTAATEGVSWSLRRSALRPTGSLYATIDRNVSTLNISAALVSQRLHMVAIELPAGLTITSISVVSGTTPGATLVNQVFGLYDASRNLLRSSVDDTSTAWGANSVKTLNLTSTYLTTVHGLFYIAILVNATTVPTLVGFDGNSIYPSRAPVINGTSDSGVTALPNPAAAITGTGKMPAAWVS